MTFTRLHVFVSGRVQGVCFRAETKAFASNYSFTGFVRNLPDSRVEVIAEGQKEELEELLTFLHNGPPHAVVKELKASWEEAQGNLSKFDITYDTSSSAG